jgi:hypothetical protein
MINEYGTVVGVFRHYIATDYFYLEPWASTGREQARYLPPPPGFLKSKTQN